jgi:hypothetical protein
MPDFLQTILIYAREGFAEVNAAEGLVIAILAALVMPRWARLLHMVVAAVALNVVVDVLLPVVVDGAGLALPPVLEAGFWHYVLLLFIGYFVVIGILFAIKRLVTKN